MGGVAVLYAIGSMTRLLQDGEGLQAYATELLEATCGLASLFKPEDCHGVKASGVMVLLGQRSIKPGGAVETCFILNKRSKLVKQGGDICCPGGRVEEGRDRRLARLLCLPRSPLTAWPHWKKFRSECPQEARFLSLLLATALRESWEEIRLNPFRVKFLGPLPSQCLILFRRVIHPMVGWVQGQQEFTPGWEVERMVYIPLRALLDPTCYAMYKLSVPRDLQWRFKGTDQEFPCFLHQVGTRVEILWGATYRIVTLLVESLFGFKPPEGAMLPIVPGTVNADYVFVGRNIDAPEAEVGADEGSENIRV